MASVSPDIEEQYKISVKKCSIVIGQIMMIRSVPFLVTSAQPP